MRSVGLFVTTAVALTGFTWNETPRLAETSDLGHHHLTDHGGYHGRDGAEGMKWDDHYTHMHDSDLPKDHCGAAHDAGHRMANGTMGRMTP